VLLAPIALERLELLVAHRGEHARRWGAGETVAFVLAKRKSGW